MPIAITNEILLVPARKLGPAPTGRVALRVCAITGLDAEQCQRLLEMSEGQFLSANALAVWVHAQLGALSVKELQSAGTGYLLVRAKPVEFKKIQFRVSTPSYGVFPVSAVTKLNRWLAREAISSQGTQDKLPQISPICGNLVRAQAF
jgi:hypothetical protein